MKSRRGFFTYIFLAVSAVAASFGIMACGAKPDAETEPSPEWPPKDE